MDVLRDPIWQFVGAVGTLAAIVVAIVLDYRFRPRKALEYQTRVIPLVVRHKVLKDRIQVLLDGVPVHDAELVTITLINTGNVAIIPADFVEPVTIRFSETSEVLQAEVSDTFPPNLGGRLDSHSKAVVLNPVLLNSGDHLSVSVFVKSLDAPPDVDGRIVGVAYISELQTRVPLLTGAIAIGGFIFLVLLSILALVLRSAYLGMFVAGFLMAGMYGYVLQQLYLRYVQMPTRLPNRVR